MVRIPLNSLHLSNADLGKNKNKGVKGRKLVWHWYFREKKIITRFKKQPDGDERRVQFPSLRNGREMMMYLVKIGK